MSDPEEIGPFLSWWQLYHERGWLPFPLRPRDRQRPMVKGFTGHDGKIPTAEDMIGWENWLWRIRAYDANLAVRMPTTVVGIDVDAYSKKVGGRTLAELETRHGALPPTWRSSSRFHKDKISGIRYYRVPEGLMFHDTGEDIETIWWGHRHACVFPSIHNEGREYGWQNPAGEFQFEPPHVDELPELPEEWVELISQPNIGEAGGADVERTAWEGSGYDADVVFYNGKSYATQRLHTAAAEIAQAFSRRNPLMFVKALHLFRYVPNGYITREEIEGELIDAMHKNGSVKDNGLEGVHQSLDSAWRKAAQLAWLKESSRDLVETEHEDDRSPGPGRWKPINLAELVDNPPETPSRFGSGDLLYESAVHWIAGEPESGKSTLAYAWAIDFLRANRPVLLLDEEAGVHGVFLQLRALGANKNDLAKLTYLEPASRNLVSQRDQLFDLMDEFKPGLVIVDSAAPHIMATGGDENDARPVTEFISKALQPLAYRYGTSVVVIDHKTKAVGEAGRYARGSGAKLANTGVAFNVTAPEPFSRGRSGKIIVECTKDRYGQYGRGAKWLVAVNCREDGSIRLEHHRITAEDRAVAASSVVDRYVGFVQQAGAEGVLWGSHRKILGGDNNVADKARADAVLTKRVEQRGNRVYSTEGQLDSDY